MEKAIIKLFSNIHGTDAALLLDCYVIYLMMSLRKVPATTLDAGVNAALCLGVAIIVGRTLQLVITSIRDIKLQKAKV